MITELSSTKYREETIFMSSMETCSIDESFGIRYYPENSVFVLERSYPEEQAAIETCKSQMTKGRVELDPSLEATGLITLETLGTTELGEGKVRLILLKNR